MKHLICTRKDLHWWGLQSLCELWWGVTAEQSMAVTFQVKCSSLLGGGVLDGWGWGWSVLGVWGTGVGGVFGWRCHGRHQSRRQCQWRSSGPAVTGHNKPVTRTRLPPGLSCGDTRHHFAHLLQPPPTPPPHPHPVPIAEGDWKETGRRVVEHKAPSSVTSDQSTKVNTPLVV